MKTILLLLLMLSSIAYSQTDNQAQVNAIYNSMLVEQAVSSGTPVIISIPLNNVSTTTSTTQTSRNYGTGTPSPIYHPTVSQAQIDAEAKEMREEHPLQRMLRLEREYKERIKQEQINEVAFDDCPY